MKMRKMIVAGASALAMLVAGATSAGAQMTVYDPSNFAQALKQVTELRKQYQTLQDQLKTANQTLDSVRHLPNQAVNEIGRQLNVDQFRNALPSVPNVNAMLNGQALGAQAQQYLNQNRVYRPTGQDFGSRELGRNAQSIANSQSLASGLYNSATQRIEALRGLEGQLSGARDAKAVADIQARIATEQAYIQSQQVQAQALQMWQEAQRRNEAQRREEQSRQELDTLIERAKARGG